MRAAVLVREARLRAGLTQSALAGRAGTTQSAIARLEAGATEPSFRRVGELVAACGLTVRVRLAEPDVDPASDHPRSPTSGRWRPPPPVRALAAAGVPFVLAGRAGAALRGVAVDVLVPLLVPDASLDGLELLAAALEEVRARRCVDDGTGSLPLDRSPAGLRSRDAWSLTTADGDLDLAFVPAGTAGFADLVRGADRVDGMIVASFADLARHLDAVGDDPRLIADLRERAGPEGRAVRTS